MLLILFKKIDLIGCAVTMVFGVKKKKDRGMDDSLFFNG